MPNHDLPAEATVSPLLAVADLNRPFRRCSRWPT
jgi:hypothetical protein